MTFIINDLKMVLEEMILNENNGLHLYTKKYTI